MLNSDYTHRDNPPATGAKKGAVYGREHVYELQMRASHGSELLFRHESDPITISVSMFVDSLSRIPNLWNSGGTDFCAWAKKYLMTPYFPPGTQGNSRSVTTSLQRCLPANSAGSTDAGLTSMFWLENIAVGIYLITCH